MFTAATVVLLMRFAETCASRQRVGCAALVALVAGVGVWTAHFVAILGYRPDAPLSYSVEETLASALVGVLLIGGPLAAACYARRRFTRTLLGALAGAGIGAMHVTGMHALECCVVSHDRGATVLAVGFGAAFLAAALGAPWRPAGMIRALLIVMAVCLLHFPAMAGVTLEINSKAPGRGFDANLLSGLVAVSSLGLSIATIFAISIGARPAQQRRGATEAERRQNRIFSLAMQNMSNGLMMVDGSGIIIAFNDRALELNHLEPGELQEGQHFEAFLACVARDNGWGEDMLGRVIRNHQAWFAKAETTYIEHKFDNGRVLGVACRPMAEGGAVLTYDDVTERYSAEETITEMAYRDALTGLPNRQSFHERLASELAQGTLRSALLLDLDRFKSVNETLGHQVGDRLLIQVAERLRDLTPSDALYRLGGDELATLLRAADPEDGLALADRLIDAFCAPFLVNGHHIKIGCSIGLARVEDGDDGERLLQKADLALYRAKGLGRNRADAYEAGMMEQARDRRDLELDLACALENGQFFLQFQPLCNLPDRRLAGFETLVRWRHPERGLVSPADFIPLAEESGLIVDIGAWILDEACRKAARWPEDINIAINISVVQMCSRDIVDQIRRALEAHDISASRLELELTETAMVEDGPRIAESLRALRRLGVRIAMDDFGTGYSSLAHLRQFEIDRIKIDRSFVNAVERDHEARAVVRAVAMMAREMSLATTGEGVASPEQLETLIELGCDTAQGFYIGRPMDAEMAEELIYIQSFDEDAEADAALTGEARPRAAQSA